MLENNYPQQFKPLVLGTFVFSCPTQTQFFHSCIFRIRYPSHKFRVFPPLATQVRSFATASICGC
jgi:hypothetical protein